ncbi:MAG: V-type ATP synthase subunit I [Candidatus Margulisiibacteriota bacterium]
MSIADMEKIAVIGHISVKDKILSILQKDRTLHPLDAQQEGPSEYKSGDFEPLLPELELAISLLVKVSGKKKSFIENFVPYKEPVEMSVLEKTSHDFDWRSVLSSIKSMESELSNLNNLLSTLKKERDILLPWAALKVKLKDLSCTKKTCMVAGSVKTKKMQLLQEELSSQIPASAIEIISGNPDKTHVIIFYAKDSAKIDDILSKINFEKVSLPLSERTASQELAAIETSLKEVEQENGTIISELKKYVPHLSKLSYVYDYFFQKVVKKTAERKAGVTGSTFFLSGWVPKYKLPGLSEELKNEIPLCAIERVLPEEGEDPPTLLKNAAVFYPFEAITRIFGLPGKGEVDPTGPLSMFYLLFFAMCLSDVGYGLILSIVSWYYLRKLTLSEGGKKLLILLFVGGIATIFVGVISGSYFGIDLARIPAPAGPFLIKMRLIDPIKNPLSVLGLSVGLGLLQIIYGIFVSMLSKIQKNQWVDGILDDGLWIFFLLSLSGYAVSSAAAQSYSGVLSIMSMAGATLLVLTQGRQEKNIFQKGIKGILSLYRTTGFLGDTLSYSRLLALMMTTSIIGMVVNIIAELTGNVPYIGYLLMVAILVVGHIFNLVISVLGAFIHSARLQLVEFFGKFYEGSGKEFKPFGYETKYVVIK